MCVQLAASRGQTCLAAEPGVLDPPGWRLPVAGCRSSTGTGWRPTWLRCLTPPTACSSSSCCVGPRGRGALRRRPQPWVSAGPLLRALLAPQGCGVEECHRFWRCQRKLEGQRAAPAGSGDGTLSGRTLPWPPASKGSALPASPTTPAHAFRNCSLADPVQPLSPTGSRANAASATSSRASRLPKPPAAGPRMASSGAATPVGKGTKRGR